MRIVPYLYLLGIIGLTAGANRSKSFGAWVQTIPTCLQPCVNTAFDQNIATQCGKNAKFDNDSSTWECICNAKNYSQFLIDTQGAQNTSCLKSKCAETLTKNWTHTSNVTNKLNELETSICVPYFGS